MREESGSSWGRREKVREHEREERKGQRAWEGGEKRSEHEREERKGHNMREIGENRSWDKQEREREKIEKWCDVINDKNKD